jgi:pimeloyl-ACP methyl ester carboxylesterase
VIASVSHRMSGEIERNGVRVGWELHGPEVVDDRPAIFLLPTWSIVPSRVWKAQIPDLSRSFRVLTFDGRGNGRSDRPVDPSAYLVDEFAADALAVMDATETGRVVLVALSVGARWAILLATSLVERVAGTVFIGPAVGLLPRDPGTVRDRFNEELERHRGRDKRNRDVGRTQFREYLELFFGECLSEPHSTKPLEDCISWGLETDPETLLRTLDAPETRGPEEWIALARSIRCPVLVLHGSEDRIVRHAIGAELARLSGGQLVTLAGSGHLPQARDPIRTNLAIRSFVARLPRSSS